MTTPRELALREILGEVLSRGHFDPFMPFASLRKIRIEPPVRNHDEQKEWEQQLGEFAETFYE